VLNIDDTRAVEHPVLILPGGVADPRFDTDRLDTDRLDTVQGASDLPFISTNTVTLDLSPHITPTQSITKSPAQPCSTHSSSQFPWLPSSAHQKPPPQKIDEAEEKVNEKKRNDLIASWMIFIKNALKEKTPANSGNCQSFKMRKNLRCSFCRVSLDANTDFAGDCAETLLNPSETQR
jgi:hypothetical protein